METRRFNRRTFLHAAGAAAGTWGAAGLDAASAGTADAAGQTSREASLPYQREQEAYRVRVEAARRERSRPVATHPDNGDERSYPNRIASYSKGLPHDSLGEVDPGGYEMLLRALASGRPEDFERIEVSGSARLVNPQAGLAFDLQGADSHALKMPPPPRFGSAEQAAEMGESYWMALTRDVPFADYAVDPAAHAAAGDLSRFADFRGPKVANRVTPATLFRGLTPGDLVGPYISQFLWQDTPFGTERVDRQMQTVLPGVDYLTGYAEWLSVQNGGTPSASLLDGPRRYICYGRDLGQWVHVDMLFQAYLEALLVLVRIGAPFDAGNPYTGSRTQVGFGTLGEPHIASVLCAVTTRALKAVWYQKWLVHRRLRPEVFAGRIHNSLTSGIPYPISPDISSSLVLDEVRRRYGTYLLPMAYPEGSPLHPSYGAGHATVAGACVTVLKAFFDESFVIPDPVEATRDGLQLLPYSGPDLTVGGELDKLASNVALGRNLAGVHWRSDATESLKLGEQVALRFLSEERECFNEPFEGFSLTTFDGTAVTI